MTDHPSISLVLPIGPSTNALHITPAGWKRRRRSPAYSKWLTEAGWEARRQAAVAGFPEITGTFDACLVLPQASTRDRSNWDKAVWDLLQHVHIIRNDSGLRNYTVVGADRDDVLVMLWDRGGPEQRPVHTYPVSTRPRRPTTPQIARFEQRIRRLLT